MNWIPFVMMSFPIPHQVNNDHSTVRRMLIEMMRPAVNWGLIGAICGSILGVWLVVICIYTIRKWQYQRKFSTRYTRKRIRNAVVVKQSATATGSSRGVSRKEYLNRR